MLLTKHRAVSNPNTSVQSERQQVSTGGEAMSVGLARTAKGTLRKRTEGRE